ncbi:MAG TPA: ethanolamine ammonia-lyase subunit EutC [Terracidiphilus sp.]|jgi:ethanolamine ammonia-lyase small subunit|nr:ethanolamine ammonia-lyase subunit EutC [Terracidiphilus sp.]
MSEVTPERIAVRLRTLTTARVGLGRTGVSQQVRDVLAFQQAHAMARDAVHAKLDASILSAAIAETFPACEIVRLHSAAADRVAYLQRPDLGRALDEASRALLSAHAGPYDVAVIVADGLSALAVERHALLLLHALLPRLAEWSDAPIAIVEQGRVAIGDEIGEALGAQIAIVLIGERPGLSSPDSLGAYITWMPCRGRTDAERVCISNIRAEGLSYDEAATQIERSLTDARQRRMTGVRMRHELAQERGENGA